MKIIFGKEVKKASRDSRKILACLCVRHPFFQFQGSFSSGETLPLLTTSQQSMSSSGDGELEEDS